MKDLSVLAKNVDEIAKSLGFRVERKVERIAFYYYVNEDGKDRLNQKDEKLCISMSFCDDPGGKVSLPVLWQKHGFTKERIKDWWSLQTFVTHLDGRCVGDYDPTWKFNPSTKRREINFDWLLPATEENFKKLLDEVLSRFNG